MSRLQRNLLLFFLLICCMPFAKAYAQPELPDMVGISQKGLNILSWTCQYDGIKSIAVQRSADSIFNYVTIGYVKNLKKGQQAFIDGHPNPGKNWYRLLISFSSDLTWYSNRMKLHVDSADLMKQRVVLSNDSLQKMASRVHFNDTNIVMNGNGKNTGNSITNVTTTTVANAMAGATGTTTGTTAKPVPAKPVLTLTIPEATGVDAYSYIKSEYVFTNPFTGHVNVELKDSKDHNYTLVFYDQKDKRVLDIPRIKDPAVIIDKRNFQKKGMYSFELMRDKEKLEMGYITIY